MFFSKTPDFFWMISSYLTNWEICYCSPHLFLKKLCFRYKKEMSIKCNIPNVMKFECMCVELGALAFVGRSSLCTEKLSGDFWSLNCHFKSQSSMWFTSSSWFGQFLNSVHISGYPSIYLSIIIYLSIHPFIILHSVPMHGLVFHIAEQFSDASWVYYNST